MCNEVLPSYKEQKDGKGGDKFIEKEKP